MCLFLSWWRTRTFWIEWGTQHNDLRALILYVGRGGTSSPLFIRTKELWGRDPNWGIFTAFLYVYVLVLHLSKCNCGLISGVAPANQTKERGKNEKFMNFVHFCEFWYFSLGKQVRLTLNFCSGMPLRKVHELTFLWFGLSGPILIINWISQIWSLVGISALKKILSPPPLPRNSPQTPSRPLGPPPSLSGNPSPSWKSQWKTDPRPGTSDSPSPPPSTKKKNIRNVHEGRVVWSLGHGSQGLSDRETRRRAPISPGP